VSIDTFRASIARMCVEEFGANIINDVSGGDADNDMFSTVAALGVPYILMHIGGTINDMHADEPLTSHSQQCAEYMSGVMAYLTERLKAEENGKVKKLIRKDIDFLDNIQTEMATARQFFSVARLKSQKEKQVFETANRIESKIAGEGFEVHRLKKPEIKRILALYFEASMQGEAMPDIDGEQFYEGTDDEDEE
jgi:dihydropteroate synthase